MLGTAVMVTITDCAVPNRPSVWLPNWSGFVGLGVAVGAHRRLAVV